MASWHVIRRELPGALALAILTGVVTLTLAVLLSIATGAERREDRIAQRCFAHQTTELLRQIVETAPSLSGAIDLSEYPVISIEGIDCDPVFEKTGDLLNP